MPSIFDPPPPHKYRHRPLADRFWAKVAKSNDADACWHWTGYHHPKGYGEFAIRSGCMEQAHRAAWELTNGPIPDELRVCHRCDVRDCVRPDHLFLGTDADNARDMVAKGRNAVGNRAKVTPEQVRQIRTLHARGVSQAQLGTQFGISSQTVWSIVHRETWQHID